MIFLVWMTPVMQNGTASAQVNENNGILSLTELYQLALERSEQVGISQEDLFLARQTRKKAFSVLVPELSAFGSHTRYLKSESFTDFFSNSEGGDSDFGIESPDSATTWGLQLGQTFTLNGKELIALKITEDSIEKSQYDLSAVKEDFLFGVAAAYFDVLKAEKNLDIAKANVERLITYRNAVDIKLQLEEVAKTDKFRAEAELSNAKAELLMTENGMKYARAVLSQLAGLDGEFQVTDTEEVDDPTEDGTIKELKTVAQENRAELKSMEKQRAIAEKQVRYYKSEYWPTVSLNGSYSKTEQSPSNSLGMSSEDFSVGLTLNFSLFDGGLKKAQVGEALAQKRQADLGVRATQKQIDLEVEQAYLSVISAKSVLGALGDQVAYARSNYEAVVKQFKFGVANSVDVMDANTLLVTAERQLADAGYTYQLAILKLNSSQGVFLSSME
jgi:outer membrane protein